jgi:CDP-glucose 4,6-dehydratase
MAIGQCTVENMGINRTDERSQALAGRRIFLTGHTGFKGSWLVAWLSRLGCETTGYSLQPVEPGLFVQAHLQDCVVRHHVGDIRNLDELTRAIHKAEPELVIHMAAQSLVRKAHSRPVETWSANVMGTVNLLEATRTCPSVRAILVITTDKCYENREWHWGYREIDPLGGDEPYSASKASAEFVVRSYRKTFFSSTGPLVATARAGNVIGGGDWSEDRLLPDAARAVESGQTLIVRNPNATRPWQHVLDCLDGYLVLAAKLVGGDRHFASSFNFGPAADDNLSVARLLERLQKYWPRLNWEIDGRGQGAEVVHEAAYLYLDSSMASQRLAWRPRWNLDTALKTAAEWYGTVIDDESKAGAITWRQLDEYLKSGDSAVPLTPARSQGDAIGHAS